jgi:hypothetical protein
MSYNVRITLFFLYHIISNFFFINVQKYNNYFDSVKKPLFLHPKNGDSCELCSFCSKYF